jgi:hypothetical protein
MALVVGGIVGWNQYREVRAEYDAYRELIQPGARVAGVQVGWLTPEQARQKVWDWVVEPYYREFTLHYQEKELILSPEDDLGFHVPLDEMVAEAVNASHQYDYWEGFKLWVQDEAVQLDLDVPLTFSWDEAAARVFLEGVAETHDIHAVEPMIDVQKLTFFPGRPGRRLDVETPAAAINNWVPDPTQRELDLPVSIIEPDQSRERIRSMLNTLGPVMAREPVPPSYYTATIPLSTTVEATGELTWTHPHFADYTGHLTQTTGFFFDPGEPGYTFNVTRAVSLVELSLRAGVTAPFTFEADPVPPPRITRDLLIPPLEARLAEFPGVTSILVKDLDSGEVIYDANNDYVLSGMSLVKIGIMVEVYRYYRGEVDAQTHQELLDMLGSESCNPCANRLMATVGGGSAQAGAQKVTNTMRRLGLTNFYLCAPFRVVERWDDEGGVAQRGRVIWAADAASSLWLTEDKTPRYDPCVKATPREMANLLDMIYQCAHDEGLLRDAYPNIFAPQVCQDMIDIMAANDLRNMLGAGIPAEAKLAHKHGFAGYDVPWGDTRAEVGIVLPRRQAVGTTAPGTSWLISFYIWDDTPWLNFGLVQPLFRDVSNMLYNYFNPGEPYWPLPPWAPEPVEEAESSAF